MPTPQSALPPSFVKAREEDEAFWCKQEARVQGAAAQPCCTFSGMTSGLAAIEGDLAVVIHGEHECVSAFRNLGPSAPRFFCTGLSDEHFTLGNTGEVLQRCLRLIASELAPEAIFILGTCPVEVIGDRFEQAVAPVAASFPAIAFVPLHTSGLRVGSQADMLDWLFSTLASLPQPSGLAHAQGPCLNLLGVPHRALPGVTPPPDIELPTRFYPMGSSLQDWRSMGQARATLVVDRTLFPRLLPVLEGQGTQIIDIPLPVGLADTTTVYQAIRSAFTLSPQVSARLGARRDRAQEAVDAFRADHQGLRLAFGLRMLNNYSSDSVAFAGMTEYNFWQELGFDITLLLQGPVEKAPRFRELLHQAGVDLPFEVFPEPWMLSEILGPDRFELAYLPDHCRSEAQKAGVPMIASQHLRLWYEGVSHNLELIRSALGGQP